MDVPRPTVAPPGRLVRLGVVLDTRNPIERLLEVARMCDRAGIGALWVEDVQEAGVAGDGRPGWTLGPRWCCWRVRSAGRGSVRCWTRTPGRPRGWHAWPRPWAR